MAAIKVIGTDQTHPYSPARLRQVLNRNPEETVYAATSEGGDHMVICRFGIGPAEGVIFLHDATRTDTHSNEWINRLAPSFGLTTTESRIASMLSTGMSPNDISQELGIATTTTAFHLRNLYQKTGTSRQAALVAKLLSHPSALIQD